MKFFLRRYLFILTSRMKSLLWHKRKVPFYIDVSSGKFIVAIKMKVPFNIYNN